MNFETLWSRGTRVALFVGGLTIMGYETIIEHADRPWLLAAALGMMGLPIARLAEDALTKIPGQPPPGQTTHTPHEVQQPPQGKTP